jgi:ATP-dependent helicase/nuclease subunit A
VRVIETPDVPKKHFSATAMLPHLSNDIPPADFAAGDMFSGKNAADVFGKIDALLDRYAKQYGEDGDKFNYGSFGTIAHICLEALLSGQEIIIPPKIAGLINPKDAGIFLEAGKELALRFAQSPLGIIAGNSKNRKNEFSFRSLIRNTEKEYFINGVIDLVFEDDDMFHVVDFKTDREEAPGVHIPQMACYYRAVSDLFAVPAKKECKTWLYYLRSGRAVDVTGKAKNPDFYMQ